MKTHYAIELLEKSLGYVKYETVQWSDETMGLLNDINNILNEIRLTVHQEEIENQNPRTEKAEDLINILKEEVKVQNEKRLKRCIEYGKKWVPQSTNSFPWR